MSPADERMRILKLVEEGRISAEEATRLIGAMGSASRPDGSAGGAGRAGGRWLRVRVTDSGSGATTVNVTVPLGLVRLAARYASRFVPEAAAVDVEEIVDAVRGGATGRLIDVYDGEDGTRVEVFVE
jgi:hypothetical protein